MIPVWQVEISTYPASACFTLQLHVEIKFCHGKAGQFSHWYFFDFFFTSMLFYEFEDT